MDPVVKTVCFLFILNMGLTVFLVCVLLKQIRQKDNIILTMRMNGGEPDKDILLDKKEEPMGEEGGADPDNFVNPEDMTDKEVENLK